MKKLQNIAAIFAAGALLLGAASCSHDGGASLAALGAGSNDEDKKEDVKSVSYDFADLTAADITALNLESGKTLGKTPLIQSLNAKVLDSKVTIKQDEAKLKLKGNGDDPVAVAFGTDSAGRGSTSAMPDLTAGSALTLSRYISYPTTSGKKIQVKVECGEGMTNDIAAGSYLVLTSADNKVLVSKAISASDTSVTLDAFDSEDSFNLGVLRGSQSGTFYVGKVTITETSGSSNDPVVDPPVVDPDEDPEEEDDTLPTVTLFSYKAGTANLTDVNIENAASDFVTISDVTFVLENDTNSIGWAADNTPGVAKVNSATYGKSAMGNQYGYMGKTAASGTAGNKLSDQDTLAKVSFTVTPKSAVTLKKLTGYLRTATSTNIKGKVTINDSHTYTSDQADENSKVVTLSDTVTGLSAANKFDVTIEFVAVGTDVNHKTGQQFDVFEVKLAFEE